MVESVRSDVGTVIPGEDASSTQSPNKAAEAHAAAIENKAGSLGWKPIDEFKGDPADWRPAKEFLDRQSLFDKIRSVKDENFHLKRDLETIKGYVEKMSDVEYKKALRDLTAQRKEAIKNAEPEQVEELDTQIDELKETRQTSVKQETQTVHPAFVQWQKDQPWYGTDQELRQEADALGVGYSSTHKGAPPEEVLGYVTDRIKKMYPEKFEQQQEGRKAAAVEGGGTRRVSTSSTKGKLAESDLDDMERRVMGTLVKRGIITKEKYLADLATAKGV